MRASASPKSPCGRNTSTSATSTVAMIFARVAEKNTDTTPSVSPIRIAATTVPRRRLPSPPMMTTTMNDRRSGSSAHEVVRLLDPARSSTAPSAASAAPSAEDPRVHAAHGNPERARHVPVLLGRAHHEPEPGAAQQEPEPARVDHQHAAHDHEQLVAESCAKPHGDDRELVQAPSTQLGPGQRRCRASKGALDRDAPRVRTASSGSPAGAGTGARSSRRWCAPGR